MVDICEHDNEPSSSIKVKNFNLKFHKFDFGSYQSNDVTATWQ
jgi:hypothetical protein